MDPLSIAVGCIGISDVIARVVPRISNVIQTVCAAESELSRIQQKLGQLNDILKFIQRAIGPGEDLPDADRDLVYIIINHCLDALEAVDSIAKEYSGRNGSKKGNPRQSEMPRDEHGLGWKHSKVEACLTRTP